MEKNNSFANLFLAANQLSALEKKGIQTINFDYMDKITKAFSDFKIPSNIFGLDSTNQFFSNLENDFSKKLKLDYIGIKPVNEAFQLRWINQMAHLQIYTMNMANLFPQSNMLQKLQYSLSSLDMNGCISAIQNSINGYQISMPDVAYIKNSNLIDVLKSQLTLPEGFSTAINDLNKSSAKSLATNKNIVYSNTEQRFINTNNCSSSVNTREMNVISCAKKILQNDTDQELFTENELMDFMSFLDNTPTQAMCNETGLKIYETIKHSFDRIGFDKPFFYHSRARKRNDAPYVWEQMKKAPYGVPFPGRYNHIGQAHFYFADTIKGTENELSKHMTQKDKEEKCIQTVKIRPNTEKKLIDLSGKHLRRYNTFLKYIRFSLQEDTSKMPREYLIPSFVSDCCKACGIDGIKYYGGKDYSNYVTWDDGCFDFVENV